MESVCINASEAAALAGLHPFRPRDEAIAQAVRRRSQKAYEAAAAAGRLPVLSQERAVKALERVAGSADEPEEARDAARAALAVHRDPRKGFTCSPDDARTRATELNAALSLAGSVTEEESKCVDSLCKSSSYGAYGQASEGQTLGLASEQIGAQVRRPQPRAYVSKRLPHGAGASPHGAGASVRVVGMCDGLVDVPAEDGGRAVVEIKNRVNALFGTVRTYERVQVTVYMFLYGLRRGYLVERRGAEIASHRVDFDEELWQDLCERLHGAAREIAALMISAAA